MAKQKTAPVVETFEEVVTPVVEEPKMLVVTADNLNVRKGASTDTEVLTVVPKNEKLLMNSPKLTKGFYSITTSTGIKGYVMKEFVIEE